MVLFKAAQPLSPLKKLLMDNEKYMKARKKPQKIEIKQSEVFSQLFRYAESRDIILMIIGTLSALVNGITLPLTTLIFGRITNSFISEEISVNNHDNHSEIVETWNNISNTNKWTMAEEAPGFFGAIDDDAPDQPFLKSTHSFGLMYIYVGLFVACLTFIQNSCWEIASCNLIIKLRQILFAQMLRQDVGWYDERENEDLTNKITEYPLSTHYVPLLRANLFDIRDSGMERMMGGLGSKVPMLFSSISLLLSGLVVGFATCWKLTLVIMIGGPVLLMSTAYAASEFTKVYLREQIRYGIAGGIVSEVLTSLRTVSAFGGEKQEIERSIRHHAA